MKQQQQQPPLDSVSSSAWSQRKNMDTTAADTAGAVVVDRWLSSMTLQDKIGQMSQIDINMLLENDETNGGKKRLQLDQVKRFIGEMGIGSVLNTVSMTNNDNNNNNVHYWTALDYRRAMIQINQVAKEYQRPPVIWGLDSVHGANYIHGAVVTPQPINIAATFNRSVAYQAGVLASRDTRAAGINWLFSPLLGISLEPLWSRVYETYGEDMLVVSEMAHYTIAGIQNYTSSSSSSSNSIPTKPSRAPACAKHFVGYSMPRHGHDRSPSWIPTRHLYQYFVPPWIKVMKKNNDQASSDDDVWIPKTVMESYTETNGIPNVANPQALQYLLRQRLEFDGVLVTDYSEIYNLNTWHHVVDSDEQAVIMALSQGTVDMSMIPWKAQDFVTQVVNAVQAQQQQQAQSGSCSGGISIGRIDISARRVLQLKHDLNMFQDDESFALQESDAALHLVGTDVDNVLDMVHQSIILTKNDGNFLPLDNQQQHLQILVTGPTSASLSYQSGGWTGQWQGVPTSNNNGDDDDDASWFTYGSTVLQAFTAQPGWDVSYTCGTDILGGECNDDKNVRKEKEKKNMHRNVNVVDDVKNWIGLGDDLPKNSIERAVVAAANMDVVVICVGEEAYTEKPGDITSLELPPGQVALVRAIQESQLAAAAAPNANSPPAKIILVYFGGRPRLLSTMVDHATAVFVAFLPGPSAGDALVDLIRGHVNPSGRLPLTYPKYNDASGSPYFHAVSDQCTKTDFNNPQPMPHYENIPCDVQWPFGHGLSYTTFAYSNLHVTGSVTTGLDIAVDVENTGNRAGWEVVMIFTFDTFRSVTPEYKRLRAFDKIQLDASGGTNSKTTVHFKISSDELRFVGPLDESHYIMDPNLELIVGVSPNVDCRAQPNSDLCAKPYDSLKATNAKKTTTTYSPACEAACELWSQSGCLVELFHTSDGKKCLELCGAVNECTDTANGYNAMPLTGATDGWGWNYVNCLESVVWGMKGSSSPSKQCWKMTTLCRDIFKTDQMNEFGIGSSSFSPHSSSLSDSTTTNIVALCFGLVSSVIIIMLMRGSCFQKSRQGKQQRRRQGEEYSAIQFTGTSTGENNGDGDNDELNFT